MPNECGTPLKSETGREGFALVAALWLSGLIAVMAAGFAISVRINILNHAVSLHSTQQEAVADGLTRLIAFRLAAEPAAVPLDPGSPSRCRWDESTFAEIYVQDQSGLVDINASSIDLIQRLVEGAGAAPALAEKIANAIGEFRDVDTVDISGSPEPQTYPGVDFGPKNSVFEAIEELDQIPGMTEPLYRDLLPHVTVHSLQAGFDPGVMSPALKSVLGFSRSGEPPASLAGFLHVSAKRTYGIDVRVVTRAGSRFRRTAVVTLERLPERPFFINTWQRGGDFEMGQPPNEPCYALGATN
jgi:general secretion pathway protein K